jgi:tetratricopeptide (TPR) repeat protein
MLVQLEHDSALRIPPGDRTFTVTDSLVLPVDTDLLAVYPHAHYLGKTFDAWATLPNGSRIPLIRILDWDINWQAVYEYKNPISLPKGTRLEMRITYDNSSQNPRNPNHPPKLVKYGDRSQDEMGHVWFQLLAKDNMAIQESVMRRRLEKYPHDFLAHYNLAALLQTQGKLDAAIEFYKTALQEDPRSATAHNSLGTALLAQENLPDAISELRKSLDCDPTYTSAHYNLARALAANGNLPQSIGEFEAVLQKQPDDAAANAALGTVEYKLHAYSSALKHLRTAAQSNPTDADLQANLGTVLAITGDLTAAQQAFETALKLDPAQPTAKANLQILKAKLAR